MTTRRYKLSIAVLCAESNQWEKLNPRSEATLSPCLNLVLFPEVIQRSHAQCYPGKTFGHRAQHIAEIMGAKIDPAKRN